jgi:hypothetical protein
LDFDVTLQVILAQKAITLFDFNCKLTQHPNKTT